MNGYCLIPGCEKPVEGTTGLCSSHNKATRKKIKVPIKKISDKRKPDLMSYAEQAKAFVKNKRCAIFPSLKAEEVHHMAGRSGEMLMNKKYWLPVSRKAHVKIEMNPIWAKQMGYSVSRLEPPAPIQAYNIDKTI